MKKIIAKISRSDFWGALFHTLDYCLKRELVGCETVLDLGCGPASPLRYVPNIKYSLGVEAFGPYLEASKRRKIHTEYLAKNIGELDFSEKKFDAVVMIEVIEHLDREEGLKVLQKAEKWAKRKVIISTPNGYFQMGEVDDNPFQKHLSGWSVAELEQLGYKVYGVSGAKFFYGSKNSVESLADNKSLAENIRFRPKLFFYALNAGVQIFTYFLPRFSFGLLAVKDKI